jgi:hypothetical protein
MALSGLDLFLPGSSLLDSPQNLIISAFQPYMDPGQPGFSQAPLSPNISTYEERDDEASLL